MFSSLPSLFFFPSVDQIFLHLQIFSLFSFSTLLPLFAPNNFPVRIFSSFYFSCVLHTKFSSFSGANKYFPKIKTSRKTTDDNLHISVFMVFLPQVMWLAQPESGPTLHLGKGAGAQVVALKGKFLQIKVNINSKGWAVSTRQRGTNATCPANALYWNYLLCYLLKSCDLQVKDTYRKIGRNSSLPNYIKTIASPRRARHFDRLITMDPKVSEEVPFLFLEISH